mmetsp:Transcript_28238/g.92594  ORF Transcript_28238/g.92594 Transcript_28238/m.92594 type:complete len:383 (-) Transcript_28238:20-1168(-)
MHYALEQQSCAGRGFHARDRKRSAPSPPRRRRRRPRVPASWCRQEGGVHGLAAVSTKLPSIRAVCAQALLGGRLVCRAGLHLDVARLHRLALGALEDAVLDLLACVLVVGLLVHEGHLGVFGPVVPLLLHLGGGHLLDVHLAQRANVQLAQHDGAAKLGVLRVLEVEDQRAESRLVVFANASKLGGHRLLALGGERARVDIELAQQFDVVRDALRECVAQLRAHHVASRLPSLGQHAAAASAACTAAAAAHTAAAMAAAAWGRRGRGLRGRLRLRSLVLDLRRRGALLSRPLFADLLSRLEQLPPLLDEFCGRVSRRGVARLAQLEDRLAQLGCAQHLQFVAGIRGLQLLQEIASDRPVLPVEGPAERLVQLQRLGFRQVHR